MHTTDDYRTATERFLVSAIASDPNPLHKRDFKNMLEQIRLDTFTILTMPGNECSAVKDQVLNNPDISGTFPENFLEVHRTLALPENGLYKWPRKEAARKIVIDYLGEHGHIPSGSTEFKPSPILTSHTIELCIDAWNGGRETLEIDDEGKVKKYREEWSVDKKIDHEENKSQGFYRRIKI